MLQPQILKIIQVVEAVEIFKHGGFKHLDNDWWLFDARETSPKTCSICHRLNGEMFEGSMIPMLFPYHTHMRINAIKAHVHMPRDDNCRCVLRWAGRGEPF